jgi:hypothetical protein
VIAPGTTEEIQDGAPSESVSGTDFEGKIQLYLPIVENYHPNLGLS